jgi:hypothetical protein
LKKEAKILKQHSGGQSDPSPHQLQLSNEKSDRDDFKTKLMEGRRWNRCWRRIIYPAKVDFLNDGKMDIFRQTRENFHH